MPNSQLKRRRSVSPAVDHGVGSRAVAAVSDAVSDAHRSGLPRHLELARLQTLRAVKAASLWDLIPAELQNKIVDHAGPLTQLLHGRLRLPLSGSPADAAKARGLWVDAFKMDWRGDLQLLPSDVLLSRTDASHITSRSMYARSLDRLAQSDLGNRNRAVLVHVPLRRLWLDALPAATSPLDLGLMAVMGGHLAFLHHLLDTSQVTVDELGTHERCTAVHNHQVCNLAAECGHLDMVEYLMERMPSGVRRTPHTMDCACSSGNLDLVIWLHETGAECTVAAMDDAADRGHLHIVQWLHASRTEGCTTSAMDGAAHCGHLNVVQWLHDHRTEGCTTHAMDWSAQNGHLDTVLWLHDHRSEGCTTQAMNWAASNGHLHVVQWLHAHRTEGCTTDAIDFAAAGGHTKVLVWLHENRAEGYTVDAVQDAPTDDLARILVGWLTPRQRRDFVSDAVCMDLGDAVRRLQPVE